MSKSINKLNTVQSFNEVFHKRKMIKWITAVKRLVTKY